MNIIDLVGGNNHYTCTSNEKNQIRIYVFGNGWFVRRFKNTNGIVRSRKLKRTDNTMAKGQVDKQWSAKLCTDN